MTRAAHLLVLMWMVIVASAQQNQLTNFCRRFGHQTAQIGRKLYIDGGLLNMDLIDPDTHNRTRTTFYVEGFVKGTLNWNDVDLLKFNTNLLYVDLDSVSHGMPNEYNNLTKPASVPSVEGGILWADTVNEYLYLYGGDFYESTPDPFALWQYDAINDKWAEVAADPSQAQIQRSTFGAGAVAEDLGRGYYYGGWMSNETASGYSGAESPLSSFVQYDMIRNIWSNSSGPDSVGRAEGTMVYLPASDDGMLIYFGGVQTSSTNDSIIAQPMNEIIIFDIANAKWYTQIATGDVPMSRRRFCAGAAWPEDRSSYNIYLYGGASVGDGTGFDDVYILSLPTFTWIKWWPSSPGTAYPHHSLTCNVINGAQMIVMGGTFPNSTQCDVPVEWGMHNLDLTAANVDKEMWYQYQPNVTKYSVPTDIVSIVGGAPSGGAVTRSPGAGWGDRDLSDYFKRTHTMTARAATRSIPANDPSSFIPSTSTKPRPIGAIVAGIVAGFAVLLIAIGVAVCFCLRARRRRASSPSTVVDYRSHARELSSEQHYRGSGHQELVQLPDNEVRYIAPVELHADEITPRTDDMRKTPEYSYSPVLARSLTPSTPGLELDTSISIEARYAVITNEAESPVSAISMGAGSYVPALRHPHPLAHYRSQSSSTGRSTLYSQPSPFSPIGAHEQAWPRTQSDQPSVSPLPGAASPEVHSPSHVNGLSLTDGQHRTLRKQAPMRIVHDSFPSEPSISRYDPNTGT